MKKKKPINKQLENPYKKVFDDANRLLKESGDMDYLDSIPDNFERKWPDIPFPYGSNVKRPYNFD